MDETLAASLEALENGDSIESILSRYPALAAELRPFLETAVLLKSQATNPTIAAKSASLAAMKKEAARLRPQKGGFLAQFFHRARRFAPAMAVMAMLFLLFMTMNAPPSSPLYGARQILDGWRDDQQENNGVIEVEETAVSPTLSPTPTDTSTSTALPSTPIPTSETTPSPTLTVSTTPTATKTATATLAPTAPPSPPILTATPLPAPTATAVDGDDDDDDHDDDDDDDELDEPEETEEPDD